ncbi:MAG: PIN domain-containing protein [Anaerolineae bacterium]
MVRARRPTVFLDADVIFAGAAAPSEHSASHVVLHMGEITLIECVTSQQAVTEVERNLADKLPSKLPEFRLVVSRCLRVVPDPEPADLLPYAGQANPKDLPLLVAALREKCAYLLTFNVRHYSPPAGTITVQQPGQFLLTVRSLLSQLSAEET